MTDKLQEICTVKKEYLAKQKAMHSFADLDKQAKEQTLPRGFSQALQRKINQGQVGLICEIKKASPSAGLIREDFDPATLARAYQAGSAACLSVLTDTPFFQGCNDYLIEARAACNLPILRKDFMIDVWQIAEARAIGADCILLIMAVLEDNQAQELHATAIEYGMDVLIETHNEPELERAMRLPSGLIGINNRNLKTLTIDLATTEALAPMVPTNRIIVSESGFSSREDLIRIRRSNAHCFLIGESLMRQADVIQATQTLTEDT